MAKQLSYSDKDIQRALNALLYYGTHPEESGRVVADKFNAPYRSTFHTVLTKYLGWVAVDPQSQTGFRYTGPNPADRESAITYLKACTVYSREGQQRRARELAAEIEKTVRKELTNGGGGVKPDLSLPGTGKPAGKEWIGDLFPPDHPQALKTKQLLFFPERGEPIIERTNLARGLALMDKARQYGVTDPLAFAMDCLADDRIF